MSRLENVIEETKSAQKGKRRAWIFNEDGTLSDKVVVADTLQFLEDLKPYEINVTDEWITDFKKGTENYYTYNDNTNASHDISIWYKKKIPVAIICIHLRGDSCRGLFSDYFAIKMDPVYGNDIVEDIIAWHNENRDYVELNDRYTASVSLFDTYYDVYDHKENKDVGEFYQIEVQDVLDEILGEKYRP